jgi:hypothetical protein
VPLALKQSFTNLTGLPFDMNDPGRPMSTDYIISGVPSRRLVFAGVGDNVAVILYEQGGYVDTLNATVFSYVNGGGAWGAILDNRSVDSVSALKAAVGNGRFLNLERRK